MFLLHTGENVSSWRPAGIASVLLTVVVGVNAEPRTAAAANGAAVQTQADSRSGDVLTIATNTQATLGDVRIGVGDIWKESYKDEAGAQKKGLTAALWIYVLHDTSKDAKLRVHPGQKFTGGKQGFEVLAVKVDCVKIRVLDAP